MQTLFSIQIKIFKTCELKYISQWLKLTYCSLLDRWGSGHFSKKPQRSYNLLGSSSCERKQLCYDNARQKILVICLVWRCLKDWNPAVIWSYTVCFLYCPKMIHCQPWNLLFQPVVPLQSSNCRLLIIAGWLLLF